MRLFRFSPTLLALSIATVLMGAEPAIAQESGLQAQFNAAYFDWDAGRYVDALEGFDALLNTTGGERFLKDVALTTGEWYRTTEIAPNGTNPRWAADGALFTYEVPSDNGTFTRVVSVDDGNADQVDVFEGSGAIPLRGGKLVAYKYLRTGPDLDAALAKARENVQGEGRAAFFQLRREMAQIQAQFTDIRVRDVTTGTVKTLALDGVSITEIAASPSDPVLFMIGTDDGDDGDVYAWAANRPGEGVQRITQDGGAKSGLQVARGGRIIVETGGGEIAAYADLGAAPATRFMGRQPALSQDGSHIAFLETAGDTSRVWAAQFGAAPITVFEADYPVADMALSPSGSSVVFEAIPREDRELFVASSDGSGSHGLTHDIQHDLFPRFLDEETVFAVIGEGRHRRSFLHDVETGARTRLFHNNTVRTVAPEYEWAASPDGSKILIVAERDGDTISPERGIYMMDLERTVSKAEVLDRIAAQMASEKALREGGERAFATIADDVRDAVSDVSTGRIYSYEDALFHFGSKFITQPGNAKAIAYISDKLRSFGYEPVLQEFEPRPGVPSANIVATLKGTVDPDLVYVLSSHFDSVERGPGSDDNTSGTTALLEAARVLAGRPQEATIQFAFFTGEEAGLLGSREFVRRAVADGVHLVGALNNDMVGFANDSRLDDTIRYSNAGIRDVQHQAAMLFTNLITYDAKYYKSTDAHAYYEAYGDIVGGIGSYPILSSPHYHQSHDVLETINHQLVAEVSKTTVATLMLLASSPSRLTGLEANRSGSSIQLTWDPAPESSVDTYEVRWMTGVGRWETRMVDGPSTTLEGVASDAEIEVRAIGTDGRRSWDAARMTIE